MVTLKKKDRELYPAHDPLIFAIYFFGSSPWRKQGISRSHANAPPPSPD
jgi:hypothetical protein